MVDESRFICHSKKQEDIVFSEANETYAIVGIQYGKTTAGAWWLKRQMFKHTNRSDNFIIAAPTYKIMDQSTLPAFLSIMDGFGTYKAGSAEFHLNGGGKCFMRTGTDPDSVVGITNVRGVWGDEAGKFTKYFWENLRARASFKQAPKMFTSTPYAMNWMFKDVLKPYKSGTLQDALIVQAKSCDNPYFPMEEYLKRKATMDPRRFNAVYNGEFEKMHGLVYDCFDEDVHIVPQFMLPHGTRYIAGIDWGTTHPFVIAVRGITPDGGHFQVSEFYKTGLTLMDMIIAANKLKQIWDIQMFYCDPSQPGYIEEFNRNGLPAIGSDNDIKKGIDLHYSLIKSGKYKIFKATSPYTIDELESYHYQEPADLGPNDKDKEQLPVDQENHCLDANRYATLMTYHSSNVRTPKVPTNDRRHESNEARIKRLQRQTTTKRSEKWS